MEQLLNDYDMDGVLARRRDELGDRRTSLETDSDMDEGSDAEDPMAAQGQQIATVHEIVELSRNMVELAEAHRNLKNARTGDSEA